jgi:uncharacterized protein YjiS (DUF1127 family)
MSWHSLFALIVEWRRRACTRRQIALLDERTIRDLGLARSQVLFEMQKPFWRS